MTDKEWIEANGGVLTIKAHDKGLHLGVGVEWPDGHRFAVPLSNGQRAHNALPALRRNREERLAS